MGPSAGDLGLRGHFRDVRAFTATAALLSVLLVAAQRPPTRRSTRVGKDPLHACPPVTLTEGLSQTSARAADNLHLFDLRRYAV